MRSKKTSNESSHITTGNVLEDLGFSTQEIREIEVQHALWLPICAEIKARKLSQAQVAKLLQIHQPDASLLLRGQLARFSITRLLQFADALQLAVTFSVTPKSDAQLPLVAGGIAVREKTVRTRVSGPSTATNVVQKAAVA